MFNILRHDLLLYILVTVNAAPHECVIRTGLPSTKVKAENEARYHSKVLLDFSLTVKAAPHECEIRTSQP